MGEIAVVGDGINDIEIIKDAGLGIAFYPEDPSVREAADYVVEHKDLSEIIGLVDIY
jgi:cation transport ATPase